VAPWGAALRADGFSTPTDPGWSLRGLLLVDGPERRLSTKLICVRNLYTPSSGSACDAPEPNRPEALKGNQTGLELHMSTTPISGSSPTVVENWIFKVLSVYAAGEQEQ
jgi:hypothetical protein